MRATFSIIIPVYNVAPYLRACLDSVLTAAESLKEFGQENKSTKDGSDYSVDALVTNAPEEIKFSSPDAIKIIASTGKDESGAHGDRNLVMGNDASAEIICIDDGSTDGSDRILDEYTTRSSHTSQTSPNVMLRVIHQSNSGVSAARNAGIDIATGDWLWFVDGDDELAPNALLRVTKEIERNPDVDIIRCGFFRISEDNWQEDAYSYGHVDLSNEIPKDEMGGVTLITWRNIFRRSRCSSIRFAPYVCGEDRLYTFECLQQMNLLVRIPDQLYIYRCRPQSYTTDVIKTYRGWEGELAYRMEFLAKAIDCRKHVHYEGASWLMPYLASQHFTGFITSDTLTDLEKRKLFRQWRKALPKLCRSSPFSPSQHLGLLLQTTLFSFTFTRIYASLHLKIFGQDRFLRKFYRRIRRHGEFAHQEWNH